MGQFLADGALSIGVFIGYVLMKLVEYPEECEKIHEEILEVVGQDRLPILEDKIKLPYTNAFIHEVIRLSDFFPMFPSLECTSKNNVFPLNDWKMTLKKQLTRYKAKMLIRSIICYDINYVGMTCHFNSTSLCVTVLLQTVSLF